MHPKVDHYATFHAVKIAKIKAVTYLNPQMEKNQHVVLDVTMDLQAQTVRKNVPQRNAKRTNVISGTGNVLQENA